MAIKSVSRYEKIKDQLYRVRETFQTDIDTGVMFKSERFSEQVDKDAEISALNDRIADLDAQKAACLQNITDLNNA